VPAGRVTTYGDLAPSLGWPRHARLVGDALARCPRRDSTGTKGLTGGIAAPNGQSSPGLTGKVMVRAVLFRRAVLVDVRDDAC
jgi:hypothetical protein